MIIKKKSTSKKQKLYFGVFVKFYFYISLILLIVTLSLFFNTGYWNNYKGTFLNRLYSSSVNNYLNIFKIGFSAFKGVFFTFPELNINISFPNIVKLENDRNNVIKQGYADKYNFLLVPGSIKYKNKSYRTSLRLKGDRRIHFKEKKYSSYKLYLKNNARIFNVRKFSLMKPRARNYIHEWIFHELTGESKLIKLKYKFINLSINGGNQGIYVFEEGFDKILLERNKRRNGPIFSIHEEFSYDIKNVKFEVYNKKYWQHIENLKLSEIAVQKLRDFLEDRKSVGEIFDMDKWASFFAVADINSSPHALLIKSVRFYYNPVIGKFEPIGFDAHKTIPNYSKRISNWKEIVMAEGASSLELANKCKEQIGFSKKEISSKDCNFFIYKFFYNPKGEINLDFYSKYRNSILKIASENYLDTFFKTREKQIDKINSKIYGDYFFADHMKYYGPGLYYYTKKDLYIKANFLLKKIKFEPEKVFIQQENQKILVQNESINNDNLIIKQLHCNKEFNNEKKNIMLNFNFEEDYKNNNEIDLANYTNEENIICKKALIVNKSNNKEIIKAIDTLNNDQKIIYKDFYLDRYEKYFFSDGNFIKLKKNFTLIDENIYIPKDIIVKIYPGQKITLINNAFIFSDSPWLVGGKGEKVFISGQKENFGGGIIISETNLKSKFTNTYFSYLSGVNKDTNPLAQQYILMGAININHSEVVFKDVEFKYIEAEDALNIINSKFEILNSHFGKIRSDALDVDFGNGEISNTNFSNIQNDAIDFSESKVNLRNIKFSYIGDKLVSVGENSIANIKDVVGKNSFVGLVSKDGSILIANNIYFNNVNIPFASYIKKPEYDKGKLKVNGVSYQNFLVPYLKDQYSLIEIDDDTKKEVNKEILTIIYNKNIATLENN